MDKSIGTFDHCENIRMFQKIRVSYICDHIILIVRLINSESDFKGFWKQQEKNKTNSIFKQMKVKKNVCNSNMICEQPTRCATVGALQASGQPQIQTECLNKNINAFPSLCATLGK